MPQSRGGPVSSPPPPLPKWTRPYLGKLGETAIGKRSGGWRGDYLYQKSWFFPRLFIPIRCSGGGRKNNGEDIIVMYKGERPANLRGVLVRRLLNLYILSLFISAIVLVTLWFSMTRLYIVYCTSIGWDDLKNQGWVKGVALYLKIENSSVFCCLLSYSLPLVPLVLPFILSSSLSLLPPPVQVL